MISPKDLDAMKGYVQKNVKGPDPLKEKKPAMSVPRGNKNQNPPKGWK